MISIVLNGSSHDTEAQSVTQLVAALEIPPETLLIEHNGVALHRSEWPIATLGDGDRIEFLRVAAGG